MKIEKFAQSSLDLIYTNSHCLKDGEVVEYCRLNKLILQESSKYLKESNDTFLTLDYSDSGSEGNIDRFKIGLSFFQNNKRIEQYFHPLNTLSFWKKTDPQGSGPLKKSLKLKNDSKEEIFDFTGGFLKDSIFIWGINGKVKSFERNPQLYHFLADGLRREPLENFELLFGDPRSFDFKTENYNPLKIYLDPMYPKARREKSKAKKNMELLKQLCGKDEDEKDLLDFALGLKAEKVVLKRPEHAEIMREKDLKGQIRGKNIRYDLY